ncbi:hypothetical protein KI387_003167, partial [Taxus chinensis]
MDDLHGILTTYEMRTSDSNLVKKDAALKAADKKSKENNKAVDSNMDIDDDKIEAMI